MFVSVLADPRICSIDSLLICKLLGREKVIRHQVRWLIKDNSSYSSKSRALMQADKIDARAKVPPHTQKD